MIRKNAIKIELQNRTLLKYSKGKVVPFAQTTDISRTHFQRERFRKRNVPSQGIT